MFGPIPPDFANEAIERSRAIGCDCTPELRWAPPVVQLLTGRPSIQVHHEDRCILVRRQEAQWN